ncbi:zf-HC2 domain-containing protein [uncultured Thiodictyon sp.]|uniref:zf-HC2 domain-containing protein n=1 Tax=uncultured Thiodictyon sp. TaxID=1846217 RepID=UPI0025E47E7C|nr:zf-HC2 domain-containing protein [uncultured Thiodictyon sp.]
MNERFAAQAGPSLAFLDGKLMGMDYFVNRGSQGALASLFVAAGGWAAEDADSRLAGGTLGLDNIRISAVPAWDCVFALRQPGSLAECTESMSMMNCRRATRLMSEELDRPLTWRERLALRLHTLMCGGCHQYREQMAFLRKALRSRSGGD